MASAGSHLSTRISAESQNIDNSLICEIALRHFKKYKVEISDAIIETFPFLEHLRDHGFITNERYDIYQEFSRNQVPVQRVVYNVLCELERTFDLPLLEVLFSDVFRRKYLGLNDIYENFSKVIKMKFFHQESDRIEVVDSPNTQLKLEQETGENSLSWIYTNAWHDNGTTPPENGLSALTYETEQINAMRNNAASDNNDALESQQASEQRAQEPEPAERRCEGSLVSSVKEENQGARTSELRSGPAAKETMNRENKSTLGKAKRRRPRKHTEECVDFRREILPVTCGEMKGMLHKNKLNQGGTVKSIKTEDGKWFTPREFEVAGGRKKTSNWKLSVRCGGKTLKWLMEKGLVPQPPRTRGRKKRENSDVCEICQVGGKLFSCGTCSKYFHEKCHLPPVETERSPWSCTFCRMQASSGSQECHRGSEVLRRQMGPEEQLKCEFLLLKAYCHLEGSIFKKIPRGNYKKETSQCMKELKSMFNKIKKKLTKWGYQEVGVFVVETYRIFENHRECDKCNYFGLMGIRLEAEFEKNFTDVFGIQDAKTSSPV